MGWLHREEEKIIEESQIPYTFLRPTTFMQNFVNFFGHTIKNQNTFYFHGGDVQINFVDARDIGTVAANILLFDEDNDVYSNKAFNVTGQDILSYYQTAEILSKEIGRQISYVDVSEEDTRHPHRGIETITLVLDGELEHHDNRGGHGILKAGDVQWMTAGKGLLHSEMAHKKKFCSYSPTMA